MECTLALSWPPLGQTITTVQKGEGVVGGEVTDGDKGSTSSSSDTWCAALDLFSHQ